jgi:hypothetical protein
MRAPVAPVAVLVAVVVALVVGGAGGAAEPATVLGARWAPGGSILQPYDPSTLRPLAPGRRLGSWVVHAARSPGGSLLAIVGERRTRGEELVLLEVSSLRRLGGLEIDDLDVRGTSTRALSWVRDDALLLATGWGPDELRVHLIDPSAPAPSARVSLRGDLVAAQPTRSGLVVLLAPVGRIGATRLVTVDDRLRTTTVPLRIRAGSRTPAASAAEEPPVAITRVPGLAVDPSGSRAVVVGYGEPVADVDLRSGAVRYRGAPVRLPAKLVDGPMLHATWLAGESVAASGALHDGLHESNPARLRPFGLRILDLRSGLLRTAAADETSFAVAGPLLVSVGSERGVRLYTHGGRRTGSIFASRRVVDLAASSGRALVRLEGSSRVALVDLPTRRVLEWRDVSWPGLPAFLDAD